MTARAKIIVVGAGPVGSVMAYALVRRGIPVVLVDFLLEPEIECRAASLSPAHGRDVRGARLARRRAGAGPGLAVFQYLDRPTGEVVATFDLRKMRTPPKHPYVLQWEQYKITQTIVARLRREPLAELRWARGRSGWPTKATGWS